MEVKYICGSSHKAIGFTLGFAFFLVLLHTIGAFVSTSPLPKLRSPKDTRCRQMHAERHTSPAMDANTQQQRPKEVVVVGGGWAGFGAASHLASSGVNVTLLEAQSSVGGLASGWETAKGKKVEVGIHGFWRSYRNIDRLITDELKLDSRGIFTPYVKSALHTKDGLSVVAPILGDLPRLPAPLGPALYPVFSRLGLLDRASALGLIQAFFDFDGSEEAWARYDKITARELFRRAGVSSQLYSEFLEPMLLVLPMCPGEDCSAAAALSCFQYFALEHQGDFDVRWLRGSASELIFSPWARSIQHNGGRILGGKRVSNISLGQAETIADEADMDDKGSTVESLKGGAAVRVETSDGEVFEADAIVLAVGISAAQFLIRNSSHLSSLPALRAVMNLRGVDVVAVRLFFKERLDDDLLRAASVAGGSMAPGLEATGLTFYHLNQLQDEFRDEQASVVEVDFYHASTLLPLEDHGIMEIALVALNTAMPELSLSSGMLEDYAVVRAPRAVSHFFPGAFQHIPEVQPSKASLPQLFFCGDWIARGGHRSWSQEKALVEGRRAAAAACRQLKVREGYYPVILSVEDDEPHVTVGRMAARSLRNWVPGPLQAGFSRRL